VAEFVAGEAGHHVDLVVDVAAEVLLGPRRALFFLGSVYVGVLGEHAQFVLNGRDRISPNHPYAFKLLIDQLVVVLKTRYLVPHHALLLPHRLLLDWLSLVLLHLSVKSLLDDLLRGGLPRSIDYSTFVRCFRWTQC
jgi:hypothetical protein